VTGVTDVLSTVVPAVDPVPWARAQMAFTLAFHIILVPLGVSWSVTTLITNYRGIRHDDPDAMLSPQRWSKYMAVTFALQVGDSSTSGFGRCQPSTSALGTV
jgi:cytochrome d ubiquinol oxidase subunit I